MKQALRTADDARRAYQTALKAVEMARENMRYAEVGYKEGVIPPAQLYHGADRLDERTRQPHRRADPRPPLRKQTEEYPCPIKQ